MTTPAPMVHKWHKLGDSRGLHSAGQVARGIRAVRSQPLGSFYRQTLTGGFPGGTGREILAQFWRYVQNEINRRGGLVIRELTEARLHAKMRRHLKCTCAWCGAPADFHPQRNQRFCSPDCRRSYYS